MRYQSRDRGGPGTPGAPKVPEGTRVYAIGDIHGRVDLLADLQRRIAADAAAHEAARTVLVYVGDYVDRGPDSFGVVDMLVHRPLAGFEVHPLKGNHEDFLLRFHDSGARGELWLLNGGEATLRSYGVDVDAHLDRGLDFAGLAAAFRNAMPRDHLAFLRGLETLHREGDYAFAHAGVRPGVPLDEQDPADLMWIRDRFLDSDADLGAVVVHGHTITPEPEVRSNRIGIDTGAVRSGRLTCLVLQDGERTWLST